MALAQGPKGLHDMTVPASATPQGALPPRRILLAGMGSGARLAAGFSALLENAAAARATRLAQLPGLRLAASTSPAAELAEAPDLVVLGPAVDVQAWLAAIRRHAPAARRIVVADRRDIDAQRLSRRNGATLVALPGDGAPPLAELAARCLDQLAPEPPPRRRRGPQPGARDAEQRRRAADLARALACGELALHYQPWVDLRSARVLGVEALARWPHPALGSIPPADFIPVAEASGLILQLGAWVLAEAVREAASWPNRALRVSVNVSPRQFQDPGLAATVQSALARFGLDPRRLQLEITEGVLIDSSDRTLATLSALRAMGIAIALDDFGTGYAGLDVVRRLPLSALKIDRSFVAGLATGQTDVAIVRAMAEMARALDLHLVAEGVETDAQRVALLGLGITEGQGWLFGRPAPPLALGRLLKG